MCVGGGAARIPVCLGDATADLQVAEGEEPPAAGVDPDVQFIYSDDSHQYFRIPTSISHSSLNCVFKDVSVPR